MGWFRLREVLVAAIVVISLWYGTRSVERPVLIIEAPRDDQAMLPVYADHRVTQSLALAEAVSLSKLAVPMHLPVTGQPLTVRLRQGESVVHEWPLPPDQQGTGEVMLSLPKPVLLTEAVSVEFDGSTIPATRAATAPRLFVEVDDTAYPAGHYQIAQNHKQGDVALQLVERVSRWQLWREKWRVKPVGATAELIFIGLGLWLVWLLPALFQTAARTTPNTSD